MLPEVSTKQVAKLQTTSLLGGDSALCSSEEKELETNPHFCSSINCYCVAHYSIVYV